jgi:hypothetical protein
MEERLDISASDRVVITFRAALGGFVSIAEAAVKILGS